MVSDAECEEKALAWCPIMNGSVNFTLEEEKEISLGIIVNLTGQASFGINAFKLEGVTIEPLTPTDPTGIADSPAISHEGKNFKGVYDLSGRKVNGEMPQGIYIKDGKKVLKTHIK